jgi:hypothetical protein
VGRSVSPSRVAMRAPCPIYEATLPAEPGGVEFLPDNGVKLKVRENPAPGSSSSSKHGVDQDADPGANQIIGAGADTKAPTRKPAPRAGGVRPIDPAIPNRSRLEIISFSGVPSRGVRAGLHSRKMGVNLMPASVQGQTGE